MRQYVRVIIACCLLATGWQLSTTAQNTVRIDATKKHQRITGFGGFVCSPSFQYNHMTNAEIDKVWGESSTVGCNIMRLYIPIGKNAWSQSLATAKYAKQKGLIVFASPWGQPSEWKTNGTSNAKNEDGTTGKLKKENWADYAQYLEEYVQYLRKNGVELDAISIQNEPDWPAQYAGCLWDASEIAEFVKTYGPSISTKVMAPETLAISDSYANALNKDDVLEGFDIYGGHQYGGIQTAYKKLGQKGKELWMTEYLINWNEVEGNTRNFDFSKDFFNFFRAINTCMLGDFNAWIHYAAKRYYGMMGDGTKGAGSSGTITKRGYIMAHFANFVTGMTRVDIDFGATGLEGSAYLSVTGDSVVAVVANATQNDTEMTLDLPFYTMSGFIRVTGQQSRAMQKTNLVYDTETCRPVITVPAQNVATILFIRSHDRQVSNMTGSAVRFDRIDDMQTTNSKFGSNYKLSGKTKTFDSSNSLISCRKNVTAGYVQLNNRYSQLVMQIKKVTTTSAFTAGSTTLYYVNAEGNAASHNYGRIDLSQGENFSLVFDLSPATLADGCQGLLSLTCDNSQSHLTITFGDVYLANVSSPYSATLAGSFVADDGYVLDYLGDAACTSIDMTQVTALPDVLPWTPGNRIVYLSAGNNYGQNLVVGGECQSLVLTADGGDFRPVNSFNAQQASLSLRVDGCRMVTVPFEAAIPEGVKAYQLDADLHLTPLTTIPAHTPCLLQAQGDIVLMGTGTVGYSASPLDAVFRGTYTAASLFAGDYVLAQQNGQWGFIRLNTASSLQPFDVYAQLSSAEEFIPIQGEGLGIEDVVKNVEKKSDTIYDLQGRRLTKGHLQPGLYIVNGRCVIIKSRRD
jgi:glucuronoarabinoxylan endo-1,4-beta-xylanase